MTNEAILQYAAALKAGQRYSKTAAARGEALDPQAVFLPVLVDDDVAVSLRPDLDRAEKQPDDLAQLVEKSRQVRFQADHGRPPQLIVQRPAMASIVSASPWPG